MNESDDAFYDRADAHIHLANDQMSEEVVGGNISASLMFASTRFNAWLTATGFDNAEDMKALRDENIEYFMKEYREMLEGHFDDYIKNFKMYMQAPDES